MAVGYNDQLNVGKMMEGNDLEKRLKLQAQQNNVYRSNT